LFAVHFNYVKFAGEYLQQTATYVCENYHTWLRRFKDKSKNVCWSLFFGPRCISKGKDSWTQYESWAHWQPASLVTAI